MQARLTDLARRYMWWNAPEAALAAHRRFIAQVMAIGTWEDAHWLLRHLGAEAFVEVLRSPPPGVLSPRAWHFWHRRLLGRAPPVPVPPGRSIPGRSVDVPPAMRQDGTNR